MKEEQNTEKQTLVQGGHDYVYCPECGARVIHESGCVVCQVCGWSICS